MPSILHTVNQSPFDRPCLQQCLDQYQAGDGIILLENGVYALLQKLPSNDIPVYAMKSDIELRGLSQTDLAPSIQLIDMHDFVRLCTEYDVVQSWY